MQTLTPTTHQQWVLKIGGWAAVVGSLLGMVGNLLHPQTPIGDPFGTAEVIAGSGSWVPLHLIIVFGIFLMLLGLYALFRSITGTLPRVLAEFGMLAAVVGVTVGLVLVIMDGVGARQLAEEWALAPPDQQETALRIVAANETINFSLASLFNFVFAGATFILFGLAVAVGDDYPKWFGWVAVAAGVLSIGAGLVQAFAGEPTDGVEDPHHHRADGHHHLASVQSAHRSSVAPADHQQKEEPDETTSRMIAFTLFAIVTVEFGGWSLLGMLTSQGAITEFEEQFFRAGHAHAGVLLTLALIYFVLMDRTDFEASRQRLLGLTLLTGILLQSGGFFLHMLVGEEGASSTGTFLTRDRGGPPRRGPDRSGSRCPQVWADGGVSKDSPSST